MNTGKGVNRMILLDDFNQFKMFVDDVKTSATPFRIIGSECDDIPLQTCIDQKARTPVSFSAELLLCSSMATVFLKTSFQSTEKEHFHEFTKAYNVRMVSSLTLENGVVRCQ